jgi:hypothetical protein
MTPFWLKCSSPRVLGQGNQLCGVRAAFQFFSLHIQDQKLTIY